MGWTDSHGRPELRMHPDIKRGVASYRRDAPAEKATPDNTDHAVTGSATTQPSKRAAG